ncbi:hypothetical protein ACIHCQ_16995 [Streptomyces sp. NPDC052236]|uniref:hypothetical protein n=1 Tax=Streptomyces sp. NPDC052236 TaxID=3365686 RepID=UPI0037D765A2
MSCRTVSSCGRAPRARDTDLCDGGLGAPGLAPPFRHAGVQGRDRSSCAGVVTARSVRLPRWQRGSRGWEHRPTAGSAGHSWGRRPLITTTRDAVPARGQVAKSLADDHFPGARRIHCVRMAPDEIEWHKLGQQDDAGMRADARSRIELAPASDAAPAFRSGRGSMPGYDASCAA